MGILLMLPLYSKQGWQELFRLAAENFHSRRPNLEMKIKVLKQDLSLKTIKHNSPQIALANLTTQEYIQF